MQRTVIGVQTRPFLSTTFAGLPASPGASTQAPFRIVYYFISATCYCEIDTVKWENITTVRNRIADKKEAISFKIIELLIREI